MSLSPVTDSINSLVCPVLTTFTYLRSSSLQVGMCGGRDATFLNQVVLKDEENRRVIL